MGIKDFSLVQASLYKYTWEFDDYMIMIGEGRVGLDIYPETQNQGTGIETMIITI